MTTPVTAIDQTLWARRQDVALLEVCVLRHGVKLANRGC
jgi:hypothetical protein